MKNSFKFTYENLENFLMHMISIAPVIPLRQAPHTKGGFIILRHDVDLDVYPAYTMAKLEKNGNKVFFFYYDHLSFLQSKFHGKQKITPIHN